MTFSGHGMMINSAEPSADGRLLVTSSNDETAKVWCCESGKCLVSLRGHRHFVASAKFSKDASSVLTASLDYTAKAWDATDGRCLVTFTGHSSFVHFADYSREGTMVVTASEDETAKIWNLSGDCLFTLAGDGRRGCIIRATFDALDQVVVLASYLGRIHWWRVGREPQLLATTVLRNKYLGDIALFWPGTQAA